MPSRGTRGEGKPRRRRGQSCMLIVVAPSMSCLGASPSRKEDIHGLALCGGALGSDEFVTRLIKSTSTAPCHGRASSHLHRR
jgi:hypothetical protein